MLKRFTSIKSPLHFGHLSLCSRNAAVSSSSGADSLYGFLVVSSRSLSALCIVLHFLHCVIGSLKFVRCPDALNTSSGIVIAPSSSKNSSFCTKCFLQSSTIFLLIVAPYGPKS